MSAARCLSYKHPTSPEPPASSPRRGRFFLLRDPLRQFFAALLLLAQRDGLCLLREVELPGLAGVHEQRVAFLAKRNKRVDAAVLERAGEKHVIAGTRD